MRSPTHEHTLATAASGQTPRAPAEHHACGKARATWIVTAEKPAERLPADEEPGNRIAGFGEHPAVDVGSQTTEGECDATSDRIRVERRSFQWCGPIGFRRLDMCGRAVRDRRIERNGRVARRVVCGHSRGELLCVDTKLDAELLDRVRGYDAYPRHVVFLVA